MDHTLVFALGKQWEVKKAEQKVIMKEDSKKTWTEQQKVIV